MNLAGLLDVTAADSAISAALASIGVATLDLSGPGGLQPFVRQCLPGRIVNDAVAR